MKNKELIWHNGKLIPSKAAKISILSHALHYGTGVFEGIRAYKTPHGTAIFRLKDHVDRLFFSASQFGMAVPYTKKQIEQAIKKTVAANGLEECYIRPIIFFGEGQMALSPTEAALHIVIAAWPWGAYLGERPTLSLGISPYIRFHPKSVASGAKISGFYATSVLATIDARRRGFDECILLDHEGYVAEGPGENIFMIKKGRLYTPNSPSILYGITRQSIMTIAKDLGLSVSEKKITAKELLAADEVFLTGTAAEIGSVGKIRGHHIGNGKMGTLTKQLRLIYFDVVHGRNLRYRRWLTNI